MSDGRWAYWNAGLAPLLGAAGVALAAVAAHRVSDTQLATASQFLIVHAAAALALTAFGAGGERRTGFLAAASLMIFAVSLFSGDLVVRAFTGERLFPFAAPTGGSLLILSWVVAAFCGLRGAFSARGRG
ncbi:MAG: DUF423 domain-containing protein [Hyphomicrobium zavarzinii]|jgi:uncharacterized membrane protein YgdD (TMEM256/DUF423 family)|uniref:DUF423 domain-containing protein n=1 Tax=Hyphomicrobium zavarzinii TaxID=48292 RepID=UPI00037EEE4C|nr:DUF423 domain-containing protein [Hyphomicrobium zavarzinii]MBL8845440.1 DUF423 domain-containing protein [Hyphomicrobium zavarzinii]HML42135.1 DUF423 domain-containing protein [Hyphomicrobium zavarzinii]